MWKELVARGVQVGKERVRKLMAQHGIRARHKRKYIATTDSNHDLPVAANLLERNFSPTTPNQVWTSDITCVATAEGWLYLAVIIDLFSRQVLGWSMRPHMKADLVTDALRMAWFRRRPDPGLIMHSDRGTPVLRSPVPGRPEGLWYALVHEPEGQLLGQCADGELVGLTEGRAPAWEAVRYPSSSHGRGDRLAELLQCQAAAFDTGLCQPDEIREELVRSPAAAGCMIPSAKGFVEQGQGQNPSYAELVALARRDTHKREKGDRPWRMSPHRARVIQQ
uniref:Integrase catalytic domain-containing protein n=1 Tax=Cupriavidus taiwanensis TaxID=164546 RepID=A0A375HE89_9BURK|nr:protein of unknown function [Cupriavidus taiwanensis]